MNGEYAKRKEEVRQEAIEWQYEAGTGDIKYSWGELIEIEKYFERLGRRYGLLREFRENGIC